LKWNLRPASQFPLPRHPALSRGFAPASDSVFEVAGGTEIGIYEQNILFDDFENLFETSKATCTEYENESLEPNIILNLNQTIPQDFEINFPLNQDINDLDISLLEDAMIDDRNELNLNSFFNTNEDREEVVDISFSNYENHSKNQQEVDINQHIHSIQEHEENTLNQCELVFVHQHDDYSTQEDDQSQDEVNPVDYIQDEVLHHVNSPINHHANIIVFQKEEDPVLHEISNPIQNNEGDDNVCFLTEDEAKTLKKSVDIIKRKRRIFAGEDLLFQAQALLSESQPLLPRSQSFPAGPELLSSGKQNKENFPACKKRKQQLDDNEIYLEDLEAKNKKLKLEEQKLSMVVGSLKSKYIEYILNKKVVICQKSK